MTERTSGRCERCRSFSKRCEWIYQDVCRRCDAAKKVCSGPSVTRTVPYSCTECRQLKRRCRFIPGKSECEHCLETKRSCSGRSRPLQMAERSEDLQPSSVGARLTDFSFSCALSYHLIQVFVNGVGGRSQMLVTGDTLLYSVGKLKGRTSELEALDEFLALHCMAAGASLSTWSALVGSPKEVPSVEEIVKKPDITQTATIGCMRAPLLVKIQKRLLQRVYAWLDTVASKGRKIDVPTCQLLHIALSTVNRQEGAFDLRAKMVRVLEKQIGAEDPAVAKELSRFVEGDTMACLENCRKPSFSKAEFQRWIGKGAPLKEQALQIELRSAITSAVKNASSLRPLQSLFLDFGRPRGYRMIITLLYSREEISLEIARQYKELVEPCVVDVETIQSQLELEIVAHQSSTNIDNATTIATLVASRLNSLTVYAWRPAIMEVDLWGKEDAFYRVLDVLVAHARLRRVLAGLAGKFNFFKAYQFSAALANALYFTRGPLLYKWARTHQDEVEILLEALAIVCYLQAYACELVAEFAKIRHSNPTVSSTGQGAWKSANSEQVVKNALRDM